MSAWGIAACSSATPGGGTVHCASNEACKDDLVCIQGNCQAATACDSDEICGDFQSCLDGICSEDGAACTTSDACALGMICVDDACTAAPCTTNEECETGAMCFDGQCTRGTSCNKDDDCEEKMICEAGYCSELHVNCEDDDACRGDLICDEESHTCVSPDPVIQDPPVKDPPKEDPKEGTQEYTEPCTSTADCKGTMECFNEICTRRCDDNEACEDENADLLMECRTQDTGGGKDARICVPRSQKFCHLCANPGTTDNCGSEGRDLCVAADDGGKPYCAIDCSDNKPCPDDATCQDETVDGKVLRVCKPDAGVCTDCFDKDGDGYGNPDFNTSGCPNGPTPDCDDNNADVHPGAQTQCDYVDNACQGRIDYNYTNEDGVYFTLEHCGACNNDCSSLPHVIASSAECELATDAANPEQSTAVCVIAACEEGWADCDGNPQNGCEVDLSKPQSCGQCGDSCGTTHTTSSECVPQHDEGEPPVYACELSCEDGFAHCTSNVADGCETDLTSDKNCGVCGNDCTDGRYPNAQGMCDSSGAQPVCVMKPNSCDEGFEDCDGKDDNGCEADLGSVAHCGGCGQLCGDANTTAVVCTPGATPQENTCALQCETGFDDCDGIAMNGCETSLVENIDNCGACGRSCALPHTQTTCSYDGLNHLCIFLGCEDDYQDCGSGGMPSNINQPFSPGPFTTGCVDYLVDNDHHCGVCGNDCTDDGDSVCIGTSCKFNTCPSGRADCDDDGSCSYDLNDPETCGGCNIDCTGADHVDDVSCHPTESVAKRCEIEACADGYDDCDQHFGNGCETDLQNDAANCGACGTVCDLPNASTTCTQGGCEFVACLPGYVNLEGNEQDIGCPYACTPHEVPGGDRPDDLSSSSYDPELADSNCDGIDGDPTKALFVDRTTGNDNNAGTITQPLRSIGKALQILKDASSTTVDQIYVSKGTYEENIELIQDVGIYGGFDRAKGWSRSAANEVIIIGAERSTRTQNNTVAVYGTGLTQPSLLPLGYQGTVVQNVIIQSKDATGQIRDRDEGAGSYGIWCNNCSSLRVRGVVIEAGKGANGKNGAAGQQQYTLANLPASCKGKNGTNGSGGTSGTGGNPGTALSCTTANAGSTHPGGRGGDGRKARNDGGYPGSPGELVNQGGGAGGQGGPYKGDGHPGGTGTKGGVGQHGTTNTNNVGSLISGFWLGESGHDGTTGSIGHGGGGGGGGGARQKNSLSTKYGGGGGGGGGAGGCPGTGGHGGAGGGPSIGIALVASNGAIIANSTITTGKGGTGGLGARGGTEGPGCPGGAGGGHSDSAGDGGTGGAGGNGGAGGYGSGGNGGASWGILLGSTTVTPTNLTYHIGAGGDKGPSDEKEGIVGPSANTKSF